MPTTKSHAISDRIHIPSADALVDVIPYLLGCEPERSAVLVWTTNEIIVLTMRVDLPACDEPWRYFEWSAEVLTRGAHSDSQAVHLVLFDDRESTPTSDHLRLLMELSRASNQMDIRVDLAVVVHGGQLHHLDCVQCADGLCTGHMPSLDMCRATAHRKRFSAPARSREEVVAELDDTGDECFSHTFDEFRMSHIHRMTNAHSDSLLELWRDEGISAVLSMGAELSSEDSDDCSDEKDAAALLILTDVKCRDAILWRIAAGETPLAEMATYLAGLVRRAPQAALPGTATVLAIVRWLQGDGLRAGIACERALTADPDYSLALLLETALRAGLPPSHWLDTMKALTYADCRG